MAGEGEPTGTGTDLEKRFNPKRAATVGQRKRVLPPELWNLKDSWDYPRAFSQTIL